MARHDHKMNLSMYNGPSLHFQQLVGVCCHHFQTQSLHTHLGIPPATVVTDKPPSAALDGQHSSKSLDNVYCRTKRTLGMLSGSYFLASTDVL